MTSILTIVKNPEKWAKKATITELKAFDSKARDAYYEGTPIVSDEVFDIINEILVNRSPASAYTGSAKHSLNKVSLPYPMFSQNKIKTEKALNSWIKNHPGPYIEMDKLDGVSFELTVTKGVWNLYTRGDGNNGKDISPFLPHLKLPKKLPEGFACRGEMIMSHKRFSKWEDVFSNARNMVSGLTNRNDIHKGVRDINCIVYERLDKKWPLGKQLASLEKLGFSVVRHSELETLDQPTLHDILAHRKSKGPYAIDGLVIMQNIPYTRPNGNPDYAFAWKQANEEDIKQVTVQDVTWQVSRTGRLTPVIEIKPIKLGGVTVTRATGHNGDNIIQKGIGPGAVIKIIRSGDVIPFITDVVKPVKAKVPEGSVWKGAYLYTADKTDTDAVKARKVLAISHFFSSIGVEGFKEKSVSKFYDLGYTSVPKVLKVKRKVWKEVLGVNGEKIYNSLHELIDEGVDLVRLMVGSNLFDNWSYSRLNKVVLALGDVVEEEPKRSQVSAIPSIGDQLSKVFMKALPKFVKFLIKTGIEYILPEEEEEVDGPLSGQAVTFTGFRDAELKEKVLALGGQFNDTFKASTTILVASKPSRKTEKAEATGVKIMTPDEFKGFLNGL